MLLVVIAALAACTDDVAMPGAPSASLTTADPPLEAATSECDLREVDSSCITWQAQEAPAAGADPTLVVVANTDEVVAVDPADGSETWRVPAPSSGDTTGVLVLDDGVVVSESQGDEDGTTTMLDRRDGSTRWQQPGFISVLPAPGAKVLGLRRGEDQVTVVDAADGRVLWERSASLFGFHLLDEVAIVSDGEGTAAVDVDTGEPRWRTRGVVLDGRLGATRTVAAGDRVLAGRPGPGESITPVLLDIETGEVTAELDVEDAEVVDRVVVTRDAGEITGVSSAGEELWSVTGRALVSRADDALLLLTDEAGSEEIALLDQLTGLPVWREQTDSEVNGLVVDDDVATLTRITSVTVHDRESGEVMGVVRGVEPRVVSTSPLVIADGDTVTRVDMSPPS